MAPYVFTIQINNKTDYSVFPVGGSTLHKLDGNTSYGTLTVGPKSSGKVEITKSGGVEGLFTALTWWVGSVHWDVKNQFLVYCEMPAGWGEDATVQMRDVRGSSWQQFKESGPERPANNCHYQKRCEGGGGSYFKDTIDQGGVRVQLERVNLDFPNSECRVVVSNV